MKFLIEGLTYQEAEQCLSKLKAAGMNADLSTGCIRVYNGNPDEAQKITTSISTTGGISFGTMSTTVVMITGRVL